MDDVNVLGQPVGTLITSDDQYGRFQEDEMLGTPFGELATESYLTFGAASDMDFTVSAEHSGTQAGGCDVIYRLRHGIERFLITDINNPSASNTAGAFVPVVWDHVTAEVISFAHLPGGVNVLYLDGHVGLLHYPSDIFPGTEDHARSSGRYGHLFDGPGDPGPPQ